MIENYTIGTYLESLKLEIEGVIHDSGKFSVLTEEQFNWKPNSNEWSVAQCFEHMRMNAISFIPVFEKLFRDHSATRIDPDTPYRHSFMGKRAIRIIGPESTRKFKTTKKFSPMLSNYRLSAVDDFISLQHRMIEFVDHSSSYNIQKIKIAFPAFRIMRLSMGDMLKFIVAHEKRHIKQARLVTGMTGFPG